MTILLGFVFNDPTGRYSFEFTENGFCVSTQFGYNDSIKISIGENGTLVLAPQFCDMDSVLITTNANITSTNCVSTGVFDSTIIFNEP
jgi:hypothetical protein